MNKYTQQSVIERLIIAEELMKKISADGSYMKIFTVTEYVRLNLAVSDAKKLLTDDLLSRVASN